jgi:hypothetical protein
VALILFLLGATTMAVIELSLSVGLITILLVFAISMVGADSPDQPAKHRLNVPLVAAMLLLVTGLTVPHFAAQGPADDTSFSETFWQHRDADIIVQIALIFAGVLGVLGILADSKGAIVLRQHIEDEEPSVWDPETAIVEKELELEKP